MDKAITRSFHQLPVQTKMLAATLDSAACCDAANRHGATKIRSEPMAAWQQNLLRIAEQAFQSLRYDLPGNCEEHWDKNMGFSGSADEMPASNQFPSSKQRGSANHRVRNSSGNRPRFWFGPER